MTWLFLLFFLFFFSRREHVWNSFLTQFSVKDFAIASSKSVVSGIVNVKRYLFRTISNGQKLFLIELSFPNFHIFDVMIFYKKNNNNNSNLIFVIVLENFQWKLYIVRKFIFNPISFWKIFKFSVERKKIQI